MKLFEVVRQIVVAESLPAWGARIEIDKLKSAGDKIRSLPAWGARIEMDKRSTFAHRRRVAPRMGSAD